MAGMRRGLRWMVWTATALAALVGAGGASAAGSERSVAISAGGYSIPATLSLPAPGASPAPAVLLLHGTASQKDEVGDLYRRLAARLREVGVASLRIDFAGAGDSTLPQTAFSFAEEVADAETALTWLVQRPNVDASRVGVVGFSEGGRVASTVAGVDPRVASLATWSTWTSEPPALLQESIGDRTFAQGYADALASGHVLVDLGFRTWDFGVSWFQTVLASHPLVDIEHYHGPLLAIAGGADTEAGPAQSRALVRHAGSRHARLVIIPGADHIFNVLTDDQTDARRLLRLTQRFVARTLAR